MRTTPAKSSLRMSTSVPLTLAITMSAMLASCAPPGPLTARMPGIVRMSACKRHGASCGRQHRCVFVRHRPEPPQRECEWSLS